MTTLEGLDATTAMPETITAAPRATDAANLARLRAASLQAGVEATMKVIEAITVATITAMEEMEDPHGVTMVASQAKRREENMEAHRGARAAKATACTTQGRRAASLVAEGTPGHGATKVHRGARLLGEEVPGRGATPGRLLAELVVQRVASPVEDQDTVARAAGATTMAMGTTTGGTSRQRTNWKRDETLYMLLLSKDELDSTLQQSVSHFLFKLATFSNI